MGNDQQREPKRPNKKPWYQRWWVWGIALFFVVAAIGGASGSNKHEESGELDQAIQAQGQQYAAELDAVDQQEEQVPPEPEPVAEEPPAEPEPAPAPAPEPAPEPEPVAAPEPEQAQELQAVEETTDRNIVYVGAESKKYHRKDCPTLEDTKTPLTIDESKAQGLEPCKRCNPPLNQQ